MKFAIVDIETTGGFPEQHGLTEIAIVLHDGNTIEGKYETLINPHQPIPPFIANMTGISNAMVAAAPDFADVAFNIHNLLKDRVFVAHNVNFDYSFVKYHLQQAGFTLQTPKLCTIRLSRKVFPGFRKYGLGNLCRELGIRIENRHRAGGDALATTEVLDLVLRNNGLRLISEMLKKENHGQVLPANLPEQHIKSLPQEPGVYYFHDAKGKVIYVGKARNLKKRVISHFTGMDASKKRQELMRSVYAVTHTVCPTEFIASLFESVEIKRLWPLHNKSQKRFEQLWGIYIFEDSIGYQRLAIDKKKKHLEPVMAFGMLADAHRMLWKLVKEFNLHPVLCFLDKTAATDLPLPETYNASVREAVSWLHATRETFLIREKQSCVLVEDGVFYGMGTLDTDIPHTELETLKACLTRYPENEVMRSMIRNYKDRYPAKITRIA
ncbi:exonuclease domain-containing protein [Sediminibacterium ginsengisoli]|uniref:DNA polymerase-3 subunit epsilon n=1 Tax=Sediminibacterium ginsengisoli TaxID=413434 RepID=A0A1T4PHY0_9BACT|nr:exonuclease domain-containing protein [Sediminibacterium ginsengisoli]SJZ91112.1 DNA polymerase-3 subunit epsilon [Sediminibacterium ginsengisoli]